MQALKFFALDKDDLEVVSAHLQDARVRVSDVKWLPQENRLVIGVDRFDWVAAAGSNPEFRRCRTGLRFERVYSCKCRSVSPAEKGAVLNLLAIDFAETDSPAGVVTLTFEGGAALRLEVECLEAEMADLGPSWPCECPAHSEELGSDPAQEAPSAALRQG